MTSVLGLFWAGVVIFVAVYFGVTARDGDGVREFVAVQPTAAVTSIPSVMATPAAAPTVRPKPPGAPESATLVTDLDTGGPREHLLFHIGCQNGILAVVTTDEILLAEWPCDGIVISREQVAPFLGQPVRITVEDGKRLTVEGPEGRRFQFNVDSAWIV
jgi:hypothetical protein